MEKIRIEKGTVQETLLLPLYGRKWAMDMYPENFMDKDCQKLFEKVEMEVPDTMRGEGKSRCHYGSYPAV